MASDIATNQPEAELSRGPARLLDLNDPAAADPAVAGRKAASLARLRGQGLPIPDGVIVPVAATTALVEACGLQPDPERLRTVEPPAPLAAAVAEAVQRLGDGPLAVRSSGVAEDAEDASYAGLYESVLGVRGAEQVLGAVRRCVASAFAVRVAAYDTGSGADTGMAVLIQRLVEADAAGVAFTANPVTGARDETVVAAVRGLGDRLVSGEATPDEWVVRDGEVRCLACPEGAIDAAGAEDIAVLARRVEAVAGTPQDIEWALADGRVYLLQARPITALPTPPAIDVPPGPWMKDTVHYTGPISPLAATAYLPRLEAGAAQMLADFGFLMEAVRQQAIGWEVYMQPVPPGSDEAAGQRVATAAEVLANDRPGQVARRWQHGGWREEFRERIDALHSRDLDELDDAALDAHLEACLELLADGQVAHFQLFVPWMLAVFNLVTTCEELLGWNVTDTLDLVAGLSEASAEPARDLAGLAADVRAVPAAAAAVRAWEPGQPVEGLLTALGGADAALADRLAEHLDRFGCRVPAYDVAAPTFAERPEFTVRLLHDLVAGGDEAADPAAELAQRREAAAQRARALLADRGANAEDRARFNEVLARARQHWGLREDNLVLTDAMPNGLLRLAALEVGRRLVAARRLRHPDDAVWLELGELRAALAGRDGGEDLRARVARRRAEHAWVRANPGPPAYGDPPSPPPIDGLPPAAGRLMAAMAWMMSAEFAPPGDDTTGRRLDGQPGSPGRVTATARIVHDESEFDRLGAHEVLVCPMTTPAWTVLFARAAAVVTDRGSPLSHAAIVAREHAIPAVVGTQSATTTIADGQPITVDGAAGIVTLLAEDEDPDS